MVDPVTLTIGGLAAAALAMAGEAVVKGAVGEAVKDAYHALRSKIAGWGSGDIDALERTPTSKARQAVVAEIIDAQPADEVAFVRALAEQLIAAVKSDRGAADDRRWNELGDQFINVTVTGGNVGVAGSNVVHGSQNINQIGNAPGKRA